MKENPDRKKNHQIYQINNYETQEISEVANYLSRVFLYHTLSIFCIHQSCAAIKSYLEIILLEILLSAVVPD